MDDHEKIIESDILLKDMFNTLITNEKIYKVRFNDIIGTNTFEPDIKKTFLKKYFLMLFFINDKKWSSSAESIIFIVIHAFIIMMSFLMTCVISDMFNNGNFLMIVFVLLTFLTNGLFIKWCRGAIIEDQLNKEKQLEYCRDDLISDFIDNNLILSNKYLENEKFNKTQLLKFVNFIQENLTQEEIVDFLMQNENDDISEPNNIYQLIMKIKNQCKKNISEKDEYSKKQVKEKNIKKILKVLKEKEVVEV